MFLVNLYVDSKYIFTYLLTYKHCTDELITTVPDVEVVADTGVVDFNSDVQGRIQNILTEKDLE